MGIKLQWAEEPRVEFLDLVCTRGHKRQPMDHPYPLQQQLVDAAAFSDLDWLTQLLAKGVQTEARDEEGRTPLHLAVQAGDRAAVCALLEAGSDCNARDAEGCSPLHHAARNRDLSMAYLLVIHGADVNAQDGAGTSVLWQAVIASMNTGTVVQFLRRYGANEQLENHRGFSARDLASRMGRPLEPRLP